MRTSEKSGTIAAALYAVHRDLENPRKDAKGQVRGRADYRYLSLPALIDHAKAALKEAQVAVIQDVTAGRHLDGEHFVMVRTTFLHLTGEWLEVGPLTIPTPNDPQQIGSAITYARRYALAAALNLAADEDDDGSKASLEPRGRSQGSPEPLAVGMGDDGEGVRDAVDGEEAATRTPDPHPGVEHKLGPAGNPAYANQGVMQCRIKGCDYVFWPAGVKG